MVELVDLGAGRAGIAGGGRVLPASSAAPLMMAEALLHKARDEARALVEQARSEAEAVRETARKAGLEAATDEIQDRLFEIAEASVGVIARSEERIIDLALQIAQRIIGALGEQEVAMRVAMRSLKLTGHSSFIRMRVAPGAVEAVRVRLDEVLPTTMPSTAVEVIGDARVRDAGCVLETDAGLIDATIDSQIEAIRRGLHRSLVRAEE